jgi:hypothetical protein
MSGCGLPRSATSQSAVFRYCALPVEQRPLARRFEVRDGGFVQMPGVVQLVAAVLVDPALGSDAGRRMLGIDRASREEIAVFLLRPGDELDQTIEAHAQLRVGHERERIRRGLDDLVNVGVVESAPFVRAALQVRGLLEIRDAAGVVVLFQDVRDGDRAIDLDLRLPEPIVDRHGRRRHRADRVVVRRRRRKRDSEGCNRAGEVFHAPIILPQREQRSRRQRNHRRSGATESASPFLL